MTGRDRAGYAREIATAFGLLTRFSVRVPHGRPDARREEFGRSVAWFPVVGATVGICAAVAGLIGGWVFGTFAGAVLVAIATVIATGGLHQDGLMDAADGLFSGRDRERMLEIMRDSRVGAMGVLAGALSLMLRAALAADLLAHGGPAQVVSAFAGAAAFGRWSMVLALAMYRPARPGEGLGASFVGAAGRREVALASLQALVAAAVVGIAWRPVISSWPAALAWWVGGAALAAAGFAGAVSARWMAARLGGLTGDCCGAINELSEIAALATFVAVLAR